MLQNYFKLAFRNMFRHKFFSFINIIGLAIGIACCLLIFLYVRTSLSYDTHHKAADNIYRVVTEDKKSDRQQWLTLTPPMLAPTLVKNFPEVEAAARMIILPELLVENNEQKFFEANFYLADSSILQILTLPLKAGNPAMALNAPNTVIISEEAAQKYFGTENPMDKILTIDNSLKVKVTGVIAKPTTPTHLKADFICSFSLARQLFSERLNKWTWHQFYTYVLLKENTPKAAFETKLASYVNKEVSPQTSEAGIQDYFHLQPVKDIYLRSGHLEYDQPNRGNINFVYAFAVIALFILIIACFNFMNLATARSLRRAKEVGVRKVIGAHKGQLITQYLGESILMTLFAFLLAIPVVELALPFFNELSGETLRLHLGKDFLVVMGLLLCSIPVGLLAGLYPAFFLSSFLPIDVLKSNNTGKGFRFYGRVW